MSELRDHLKDLLTDAMHEPDCGDRCVCLLDPLRDLLTQADLADLAREDPEVHAAALSVDKALEYLERRETFPHQPEEPKR